MDAFFSQPIEVKVKGIIKKPVSFHWNATEYRISEIWAEWQDAGFGSIPAGRGKWWQRRHRNYFRVVTDSNEVFEIYLDRGGKRPQWYLYRQVDNGARK
jgi:hypothetical protein